MNKFGSISAIILLGLIVSLTEAGHVKRSVIVASPVGIAAPVVASPVAVRSHVVHTNPTTVVSTPQYSSIKMVNFGRYSLYIVRDPSRSKPSRFTQEITPLTHTPVRSGLIQPWFIRLFQPRPRLYTLRRPSPLFRLSTTLYQPTLTPTIRR